jgi:hypothetical protein
MALESDGRITRKFTRLIYTSTVLTTGKGNRFFLSPYRPFFNLYPPLPSRLEVAVTRIRIFQWGV